MSWVITGSQKVNWTPSLISTALWLDAADASTITLTSGAVSQWNDKSGNARHATQSTTSSRPSYSSTGFNSLPGVAFDGVDDNMLHGCTQTGQYTLIAVYKVNSAQTGFRGVFNVGPANNSGGTMLMARTSSAFVGSFGGVELNSTVAYANGQSLIAIIEDDNGSAIKSFWINGTQSGTFTNNPDGQGGSVGGIVNQYAAITMAECLAIPSVASTSTRQLVEGYLAHKWGLAANLPAGHPYKVNAPVP